MAVSAETFWSEIGREAGLSDDQAKAIAASVADPKVLEALEKRGMRQSDYSREMDKVRGLEQRNQEYYTTELAKSQQNAKVIEEAAKRVQAYEQMYGPLDGNGNNRTVDTSVTDSLKKDIGDLRETLNKVNQNAVSVIKDSATISIDYYKRFGEVLPVNDLEKYAIENSLPLRVAYDRFISPKLETQQKAEYEAKIKAAREEGFKDAVSKHHLPTPESKPQEESAFRSYQTAKAAEKEHGVKTGRQLRDSFVQEWEGAANAAASK